MPPTRLPARPHALSGIPPQVAGMVAMCAGMLLLPVGDSITKVLTSVLPPAEIAAARTVVQAAALWGVMLAIGPRKAGAGKARAGAFSLASLVSGLLMATVAVSLISSFRLMPIATAIAIFFVEPLLLILLSGPLLGERPGPRRLAAVAAGMAGVLLILRPNYAVFGTVVFLPLLAALAFALNMIVTRRATRNRSALTFQSGASVFGAIGLILFALPGARPGGWGGIPLWAAGMILLAGALAALTFLLIAYAFSRAEASVLAPLQYLEILGATVLGYLIFGDGMDGLTILGTLIVLGSGLYVFHREGRARAG